MSRHAALQRLIVRLQHDPSLRARLLEAPDAAHSLDRELARLGLGDRERDWLRAVDKRAWKHDPLKARRLLHGLMSELKAATAIALAETRRLAFLDAFIASQQFHDAVQYDRSLLAAFADYLLAASLGTPQLAEVVRIEATLGRSRRALEAAGGVDWRAPAIPPSGLTHVARAPGVEIAPVSPDGMAALQAAETYLFEVGLVPAIALADDAPRLTLPAPTGAPPLRMGFIPTQSSISLVELDDETWDAIAACTSPATPIERVGRAIAASLVEDEVLVAAGFSG